MVGFVVGFGGLSLASSAWTQDDACTPNESPWSVARQWNEATLDAIRRDEPAPTVHARNLFHTSVAMWDAWASYDGVARGYLVTE